MPQPGPNPAVTPAKRLFSLRDLWPFLRPYRRQMVAAFLLQSLGSATILLVPLAFRDLSDFGFGAGKRAGTLRNGLRGALSLNGHFLALFGLAALWALAVSARYYLVTWIGERVTADLRSAVYARVLTQAPQFFETLQPGEMLSRLTGDTTLIQTVVGSSVSMGLRSLFQFTGGMIMLAVTSFYLFSLNFGLMALLALPNFAIGRAHKKLSREAQDKIADASALAGEILNAMPTVQSYTQEQRETRRFSERAEASFASAVRRTRVRAPIHSTKMMVPDTAAMMRPVSSARTRVRRTALAQLASARSLKRRVSRCSWVYDCTVGMSLSISPASAGASAILSCASRDSFLSARPMAKIGSASRAIRPKLSENR